MNEDGKCESPNGLIAAIDRFRIKLADGLGRTMLVLLVFATVALLMPSRALAESGYWECISAGVVKDTGQAEYQRQVFRWKNAAGENESLEEKDLPAGVASGSADHGEYYLATEGTYAGCIIRDVDPANGSYPPADAPSWAPVGWTVAEGKEEGVDDRPTAGDTVEQAVEEQERQAAWRERTIAGDDEAELDVFDLGETFPHWIMKHVFDLCKGIISTITELSAEFCKTVDVNTLFTSDFEGTDGAFSSFYTTAKDLSTNVAQNYGLGFLGIVFSISLIAMADDRHGRMGTEQFGRFCEMCFFFALGFTLITHAMDILSAIYWVCLQFSKSITNVLSTQGAIDATVLSTGIDGAFDAALGKLTYEEFPNLFIYIGFAVASLIVTIRCVAYIFTTAFLRMAEIYLRAAFAPIPFGFFSYERTRPMFWNYIKRFAAVCIQAALIITALSFSGLLMVVAGDLISNAGVVIGEPATGSTIFKTIASVLPPLFALFSVTSIIRRTEQIAASLFGMG